MTINTEFKIRIAEITQKFREEKKVKIRFFVSNYLGEVEGKEIQIMMDDPIIEVGVRLYPDTFLKAYLHSIIQNIDFYDYFNSWWEELLNSLYNKYRKEVLIN